MGFKTPTPIQQQAIPVVLNKKDLIACAQTGTGKTAAYLLPILNRLTELEHDEHEVNTIIIVPTRELALQIDQQIEGLSYFTNVSSLPVYGGGDGAGFDQQKSALSKGADIIVATPGKLLSHLNLGYVKTDKLQHLVLDEADRMLDMGFYDDIMKIINYLPKKRQTLLFSATMPPKIREMAKRILVEPEQINIALSKPAAGIKQEAYVVYNAQKIPLIQHLLKDKDIPSVVIFSGSKLAVKEIEATLKKLKYAVSAIHSDLEQTQREEVLRNFRGRRVQILVATDILARGIDIEGINLVVNYDVPGDAEDYVHRIGRTARASSTGHAVTFINENDQPRFSRIEKLIEAEVPKIPLPPEIGEGPPYAPEKQREKKPFYGKKRR